MVGGQVRVFATRRARTARTVGSDKGIKLLWSIKQHFVLQLPQNWFVNSLLILLFALAVTIILALILAVLEFILIGCCTAKHSKVNDVFEY
jgi:hypothetical protein